MASQLFERLRVCVLAGGDSAEREISLASGRHVATALRQADHRVRLIDPSAIALPDVSWTRHDACLIALHGGAGEDGRVQAELERLGVTYTGSGPASCRTAMSKSASKERFAQAGVPTPAYVLGHTSDPIEQFALRVAPLGYPLVVKPDGQGSSLGVSIVRRAEELAAATFQSQRFDPFVVAERFVPGREFTVGLIDHEPLPAIEIVHDREFFDYDAKYESARTKYRLTADLQSRLEVRITDVAVAAADALGMRGASRVDLRLDDQGRPWVLEVNAVPGLTEHSLLPMAAAAAGMSMDALCERMLRSALGAEVLT